MLSLKVENNDGFMRKEYFTQNGRAAFKTGIRLLGLTKGQVILIPAYIGITDKEGSGVLDPIEESGASYAFYAVDEHLSP
ncbi:MAG: perosamine synthetase-related protein, partial [Candidatus Uhrbacteria bacterium]|nr:perosamine synthetase-related protein [Candidatus Uhrbacteria bacterium]